MTRSAWLRRWFPWIQITWLAALSPLILFFNNSGWWLIGIPIIWIMSWLIRGHPLPRSPLNISVILMGSLTCFSLLITPDIALSLPKAAGLFLGLAFFFAVADLGNSPHGVGVITSVLLLIGFGISVIGIFETHWLDKTNILASITASLPRLNLRLPGAQEGFHPNEIAGTILWVLPLSITVFIALMRRQFRRLGIVVGLIALLMFGVLLISQSRSGWFGLLIASVVMTAFISRPVRWGVATLVVLGLFLVALVGPARIGATLFETSPDINIENPIRQSIGTLDWNFRVEVWKAAAQGIADFPLTGMGIGTFREVGRLLYTLSIPESYDFAHAHNEFLQAALDLGIPGLMTFVAIYFGSFWMLWKIWCMQPRPIGRVNQRYLALGLVGGLVAHLGFSLTDAVALGAKPGILFWMLLGLIAGLFLQTHPTGNVIGMIDRDTMHTEEAG